MIAACSGEATEHVRCLTRRLTATGSPLPHHQPRVYAEPGMVIGTGQRLDGSLSDDTYDGTYRQPPRALGAAEGLRVAAVEVGQVDGIVAAVDPVEEAGVDRYPVRKVLAGDDGLGIGAVEAGPVDRAGAGAGPARGPVDVAGVHCYPRRVAAPDGQEPLTAAIEVGPGDRAAPVRDVIPGRPVEVAGVDRHGRRVALSAN